MGRKVTQRNQGEELLLEILQLSLEHIRKRLKEGTITPSELATAQKLLQQHRVEVHDLENPDVEGDVIAESPMSKLPFTSTHLGEEE